MTLTAQEQFDSGNLQEAILMMNEEVRHHPADLGRRGLLIEFLCLAGNLDRADVQLETLAQQEPGSAPALAQTRQVVRAEAARRDWFTQGRLPELTGPPPASLKHYLEAVMLVRESDMAGASQAIARAEAERSVVAGICDGTAFNDMRDADDLTAGLFEVLTTTGKYFWVAMEQVSLIEFQPPRRPRDLLWRRAHMVVRDGPEGEVFLPAIYPDPGVAIEDRHRLARATDWTGGDGAPVRGIGQRIYLIGEAARPILEIGRIEFRNSSLGNSNG